MSETDNFRAFGWDRIAHMNTCRGLKPVSGGTRQHWRIAGRAIVAPKGSWDRLTAETWADWRGACEAALDTFRSAVNPTAGALLAQGETVDDMMEGLR